MMVRLRRCLLLLLALLTLTPAARAAGADALVAERITRERFTELQVGGPDADAGVGDWVIQNGVLCAAISDALHESALSPRGGVLVDLGHCGRDDDQWSVLQPLLNLSRAEVVSIDEVRAERDEHQARIVTRGRVGGVGIENTFALGGAEPHALEITTRVRRREDGERFFTYGSVALHPSGRLRPFSLYRPELERSTGFRLPGGDPDSPLSLLSSLVAPDVQIMVGSSRMGPGISYGLELRSARRVDAEGAARDLPALAVAGIDYSMMGVFSRPFWLGSSTPPGLIELPQIVFMDLAVGEHLEIERRLWVGERADTVSLSNRFFADQPALVGRVDDPDARVHVEQASGAALAMAAPDPDGRFTIHLPPGSYRLRAVAPGGREVTQEVAHPSAENPIQLAVGAPASLELPEIGPARLVFRGLGDTPDPVFGASLDGLSVGEVPVSNSSEVNAVSLAGVASDPRRVTIAPGWYRVHAMRGPEFTATEAEVVVTAGSSVPLEIEAPTRAFETPGWVAADLHVHTGASFDSALPPVEQLRAFVATGSELVVVTEHDRVVDPGPALRELGEVALRAVTGVEITSEFQGGAVPFSSGHTNAFPLEADPSAYRGGAPAAEARRLREIAGELRQRGDPVFQLNHPRRNDGGLHGQAYFSHLGAAGESYDPTLPLDAPPNRILLERDPATGLRDLDFHAIELLNGSGHDRYRRTRADWISLMLQDERRTATANSDSHHLGELPGLPRNYLALAEDADTSPDAWWEALRAGHVMGTTGPFVRATLDGRGPGGTASGMRQTLVVRVDAAPWVPVERLRVYVDADLVHDAPVTSASTTEVPLELERDAHVWVEVEGPVTERYATLVPGFRPLAFTNPILVDADGDGAFTPSGLPAETPPLLSQPTEVP